MSFLTIVDYNFKNELEHGVYVSRLSREIALELGLDDGTVRNIGIAGILHDIGKLSLMSYLNDEGKEPLVIEQMKYVRLHPEFSFKTVRACGYSEEIQNCVRWHHENYDGTGYPDSLAGEDIPIGARIIRVSDVYAALTSDRPYRKSFDPDTAMELMIEEIAHFDMDVFLAFQRVIHKNKELYNKPLPIESGDLNLND